jgi:hypothetical protein
MEKMKRAHSCSRPHPPWRDRAPGLGGMPAQATLLQKHTDNSHVGKD